MIQPNVGGKDKQEKTTICSQLKRKVKYEVRAEVKEKVFKEGYESCIRDKRYKAVELYYEP